MDRDRVHELARGRIWSGEEAKRLGLVDELGGFSTALRLARAAAGLESDADIRLREFPRRKGVLRKLSGVQSPGSEPEAAAVLSLLDPLQPVLAQLNAAGTDDAPVMLLMPEVRLR